MTYRLNLDLSPRKVSRSGIDLYFNWANRVEGGGTEPAYLFTLARDRRTVVAMRLSELHAYVESTGFPITLALISMAAEIAGRLGFSRGDRSATKVIADLILDHVEDLKNMPGDPPAPVDRRAGPKADLTVKIDGQTVLETEVAA